MILHHLLVLIYDFYAYLNKNNKSNKVLFQEIKTINNINNNIIITFIICTK